MSPTKNGYRKLANTADPDDLLKLLLDNFIT
jgi:hypothetical protein